MRIHHLTPQEALDSLATGADGLASAEAARRLAEYGANAVAPVEARGWGWRLLDQFTHFFAVVLWVAAGLALAAEAWRGGEGMAVLAAAIVAVIVINGLFSFWQESRSERALQALRRMLPHSVAVVRDGTVQDVAAETLVPGDVVLLQGGDTVPADCRIVEAMGVQANLAAVTGESAPVLRGHAASGEHDLVSSANVLLAGTALMAGEARAVVFATGMRTQFGRIAELTQQARPTLSPLQREVVRLSRIVAALALGLAALFFAVAQGTGMTLWDSTMFAIGILVANVPEGLLPTVTLALAMGAKRLARKNMLVRHLPAVEALGSVTVICTDKTGTLTENRMVPRRVYAAGHVLDTDEPVPEAVRRVVRHCHSVRLATEHGTAHLAGDPTEIGLLALAGGGLGDEPRLDELPFDAERKRMSTLHRDAEGAVLYAKGALETVLPLCRSADGRPLSPPLRRRIRAAEADMAAAGLRVLALAWRRSADGRLVERDLDFLALVGLEDPIRPEVPDAVRQCRGAGIRPIMVTGDHPQTARAVARAIGLVGANPTVLTGDHLQRLSDTQLQLALDAPDVIFARTRVDQKRRIVAALQAKREVVAVTGDGVNDAPALRQADIGIAMGRSGTDVAREAADMILVDDNFASVVAAIEEGRAVFDNIRKFLTYILTSNIPEIVPFLAFVLLDLPLALTVVQILAVDLGTDMVPALALAAEKPQADVMRRPPRRREQRLIDWPLIRRAYLFLGPQQALAAMVSFLLVLAAGGWRWGQAVDTGDALYVQATTACLSAIVVMQMANLFVCRSSRISVLRLPPTANPLLFVALAAELSLIVAMVYTPAGNLLFGTAPLPAAAWLAPLPFAAAMLVSDDLRKAAARRVTASASCCRRRGSD